MISKGREKAEVRQWVQRIDQTWSLQPLEEPNYGRHGLSCGLRDVWEHSLQASMRPFHHPDISCSWFFMKLSCMYVAHLLRCRVPCAVPTTWCDQEPQSKGALRAGSLRRSWWLVWADVTYTVIGPDGSVKEPTCVTHCIFVIFLMPSVVWANIFLGEKGNNCTFNIEALKHWKEKTMYVLASEKSRPHWHLYH